MEWVKVALEALARNSMGATCFLNLFPVSSQVEALFQSIDRDVALQSLAGRVPGAISLEEMWHQMERLRLEIAEERGFPRETHHADCEA